MNQSKRILGRSLFNRLMKATVYGQFVAGEDLPALRPTVKRFRDQGIRSILDYAVEDDVSESKEVSMEIRYALCHHYVISSSSSFSD